MNQEKLAGEGRDLGGKIKATVGDVTGDDSLQAEGTADQLAGKAHKGVGAARDFARQRPWTAAALAGVVGLALLNTLRGKL